MLAEKIRSRAARAGVIGLGYVGLPLAVELGRAGYGVTGVDMDDAKVAQLRAGRCSIPDVEARPLRAGSARRIRPSRHHSPR